MHWILCAWLILTSFGLAKGHNTLYEGYDLSLSGYHLCSVTESVPVTNVVSSKTSYTLLRPCGGWLPWKTCNVTLYTTTYETQVIYIQKQVKRCCEGYEQVGSYCALSLNRSQEFTAKPGGCPAQHDPMPGLVLQCKWDTDCPGWQKCCQMGNVAHCAHPHPIMNRSWWLSATVTVKALYQLVNTSSGVFNHTRLLHSVVTGALNSTAISAYHTHSWPAGPFTTSSLMLIGFSDRLFSTDTFNRLQFLLETIEEVTAVDVNDVDECGIPALRGCSPVAICINTNESYNCTCPAGSVDLNPSRPGTQCMSNSPSFSTMSSTVFSSEQSTPHSTVTTPEASTASSTLTTTDPSTASSVQATTSSSTPPSTQFKKQPVSPDCSIPQITNIFSHNVMGSSFRVSWDAPSQIGLTSLLVLLEGSRELERWKTALSELEVSGVQSGVLYTVQVSLCACGHCGNATELRVKTDVKTLKATARLTSVKFIEALKYPDSEEFRNLSESIRNETIRSLPSSILSLVWSGKVLVLITKLSSGSVVVTYTLIFLPDSTEDILTVAYAMIDSLLNSSVYTVDRNGIFIEDVDECMLGEDDCSPWAACNNTFGSYTCACQNGYTDANPTRPGRTCQATNNVTESGPVQITITTPTQLFTSSDHSAVIATLSTAKTIPASTNSTVSSLSSSSTALSSITVPVMGNATMTLSSTMPTTLELTTTQSTESATTEQTSHHTTTTTSYSSVTSAVTPSTHTSAPLLSHTDAISVECRLGSIAVSVARNFLLHKQISEASLYLGQPDCGQRVSNNTHVQLVVTWGECGANVRNGTRNTTVQVTLYNNMSSWAAPGGLGVPPTVRLELPVICTYINSIIVSAGYPPSGYLDMIDDALEGSGTFHVTFRLLNGTSPLPQNYTLSPTDEVIIEVEVNSTLSQIKVVINKCWANPTNNPNDVPQTIFLENSCPLPNPYTTVIQNGNSTKSLLGVNIFSLVKLNVVYLHCQIQICIETPLATCKPACLARSSRNSNVIGVAKASCGPLLRAHAVNYQEIDQSMHVMFILLGIGLLVFALAGVAAFLFYKKRIGRYNFNFKPRQENFSYHVFDS